MRKLTEKDFKVTISKRLVSSVVNYMLDEKGSTFTPESVTAGLGYSPSDNTYFRIILESIREAGVAGIQTKRTVPEEQKQLIVADMVLNDGHYFIREPEARAYLDLLASGVSVVEAPVALQRLIEKRKEMSRISKTLDQTAELGYIR